MAEQLDFRLEPALPRPGDVEPMWPTPRDRPFDSPHFLFEPAWGGRRALAFVGPAETPGTGEVRLVAAGGEDLSARLPELAGLAVRVSARSAVLDGELVVVDGRGRADPGALERRLAGQPGRPVAYLVFDILHLDGRWLLRTALARRREALRRTLRPGDEVVMVPAIAGEGRALHDAVTAQGIAGVLARRRSSPYLPGVRSTLWRSIPAGAPAQDPAGEPAGGGAEGDGGHAERPARPDAPGPGSEAAGGATGPVLALFRRLPFEEDEPGA